MFSLFLKEIYHMILEDCFGLFELDRHRSLCVFTAWKRAVSMGHKDRKKEGKKDMGLEQHEGEEMTEMNEWCIYIIIVYC